MTFCITSLILVLSCIAPSLCANGGLCANQADGIDVARWTFSPGFGSNVSATTLASVPDAIALTGGATDVGAGGVAWAGQPCGDVIVSGARRLSVEPELELSKAAIVVQAVVAVPSDVPNGKLLSVSYVPSAVDVVLDDGLLALVRSNAIMETAREKAMVTIEPDDWRVLTLWLTDSRARLYLDRDLIATVQWDFAGSLGIGGDSSLAVSLGPIADRGGLPAPMLVHSLRLSCRERFAPLDAAQVLALITPARLACPRRRSPHVAPSGSDAPGTTPLLLDTRNVGTIGGTSDGAADSSAPATAASPAAVPGWLVGAIVGISVVVLLIAVVAFILVNRKLRRDRMARVAAAIEMERKSVRRPGQTMSAHSPSSTPTPNRSAAPTYTQQYSGVGLTEAINDDITH